MRHEVPLVCPTRVQKGMHGVPTCPQRVQSVSATLVCDLQKGVHASSFVDLYIQFELTPCIDLWFQT